MVEKFTFFWNGPSPQWHPFSQWHPCEFVVDGVKYNCAEQFMMASKASFFGDNKTLKKIMDSNSPREQKKLGREVENFDVNKWDKVAKEFVKQGNIAKFSQNTYLKNKLLATDGTTLVEASPYDKIWGIGLAEDNPLAQNRDTWQGKNWLGEVLTNVREILKGEEK